MYGVGDVGGVVVGVGCCDGFGLIGGFGDFCGDGVEWLLDV